MWVNRGKAVETKQNIFLRLKTSVVPKLFVLVIVLAVYPPDAIGPTRVGPSNEV